MPHLLRCLPSKGPNSGCCCWRCMAAVWQSRLLLRPLLLLLLLLLLLY
jgi:hypothetical protein